MPQHARPRQWFAVYLKNDDGQRTFLGFQQGVSALDACRLRTAKSRAISFSSRLSRNVVAEPARTPPPVCAAHGILITNADLQCTLCKRKSAIVFAPEP